MPSVPFTNAIEPTKKLFKRLITIRPKEAKFTVGLDIGSTSIKAIALGPRRAGGARAVLGQQLVAVEGGPDTDPTAAIKTAISALQLPIRTVNLSVSGQWVIMRVVEMPTMKPAEMKQALPFEAQRYLPFNVQDVVIDGAALGPADANKTWVLIVACKKELLERRIDSARRAGLEVVLIDVDALAVANALLSGQDGRRAAGTLALINVGGQLTNLVIFRGETPYLVRDIPWGADKLIRSVSEQAGMDADAVKQGLAASEPNSGLVSAMKLIAESLVTELQLSFDYFENRFGQPPEEIRVSGGLGQSPAFVETLKSHLAQAVTAWTPVKGLPGQFAVAYGLALRTG